MKKFLAILITIIISLVVGFAGGVYYASNHGDHYTAEDIEEKVVEISELATLQFDYTEEGTYKGDAKKVLGHDIPFTKKSMQIQYSGTVKMGPALQDRMKVDLDQAAKKVTITIPHSEILSHEVNEDSIKIIYVKNGIFNSVTPENTNQLRKDMKAEKEKSIKSGDYLKEADENAVKQITQFLNTVYPDLDATVEF